jgi:hypothetical protein
MEPLRVRGRPKKRTPEELASYKAEYMRRYMSEHKEQINAASARYRSRLAARKAALVNVEPSLA